MLVLYEKPTCTTCKKTMELLKERGVDWEDVHTLRRRVSHLLPALVLARIDGKSPLEYLATAHRDQEPT